MREIIMQMGNRVGAQECLSVGVGRGLCRCNKVHMGWTSDVTMAQGELELVSKCHEGVMGHNTGQ